MDITTALASESYKSALSVATPEPKKGAEAEQPTFLERFASDFVDTLKSGEKAAEAGLTGKANAHSVVEALAATELAVETAVTVRDKVVEAYQEILRMPV